MKKNSFIVSLLLGGLFLASPSMMAQDKKVKLITSKAVGSPISLLVNQASKKVTVDWGDGNAMTYQTNPSDIMHVIGGTVKGDTISIYGNINWNTLSCANCGIKKIDLSAARDLHSLYCRNNEIDTLDLRGMTKLVDLDCSYNHIKKIVLTSYSSDKVKADLSSIENLNLSNNELTGQYSMNLPTLQNLNISSNQYEYFYMRDNNVKTINCANNKLKGILNLTKVEALNYLICHNNAYTELRFNENKESLHQLICDNNALTTIDLSTSKELNDLSCSNNKLFSVELEERLKELSTLNVSGNNLTFSVLPTKNDAPEYLSFMPQNPFNIAKAVGMMEKEGIPYAPLSANWSDKHYVDLKPFCSLANKRPDADNLWVSIQPDGTEIEMTRRRVSSGTEDFYTNNGRFAFFTPQKKAYVKFKSKTYGYEIQSLPIAIGDDITGVEHVLDNENLQITIQSGAIVLNSNNSAAVRVYTTSGKLVWSGIVNGTQTLNLPQGVYVVNGHKAIL